MHDDCWAQYYTGFVEDRCAEKDIQSISEVKIDSILCSSPQVVSALFDDIGFNIDKEHGLKKLHLDFSSGESNTIQDWSLSQILVKSLHIEELYIGKLHRDSAANHSIILTLASELATQSCSLQTLFLQTLYSSAQRKARTSFSLLLIMESSAHCRI